MNKIKIKIKNRITKHKIGKYIVTIINCLFIIENYKP